GGARSSAVGIGGGANGRGLSSAAPTHAAEAARTSQGARAREVDRHAAAAAATAATATATSAWGSFTTDCAGTIAFGRRERASPVLVEPVEGEHGGGGGGEEACRARAE